MSALSQLHQELGQCCSCGLSEDDDFPLFEALSKEIAVLKKELAETRIDLVNEVELNTAYSRNYRTLALRINELRAENTNLIRKNLTLRGII